MERGEQRFDSFGSWFPWRRLGRPNPRMVSTYRNADVPMDVDYYPGFRVASLAVPEPGSLALVVAGGLCLAAFAWRRRRV